MPPSDFIFHLIFCLLRSQATHSGAVWQHLSAPGQILKFGQGCNWCQTFETLSLEPMPDLKTCTVTWPLKVLSMKAKVGGKEPYWLSPK